VLDKSVPYIPVTMKREAGLPIPAFPLPEGYNFLMYEPGMEKDWARIEASVGEFDCEMDALLYFRETFLPFGAELPRRCMFIAAPCGELVGTATAWWNYVGCRRHPQVHWVAVKPAHQGRGLGKALTAEVLRLMEAVDGEGVYYLGTQTNSHVAIRIYEWAGFHVTDERNVIGRPNDQYNEAITLLDEIKKGRPGQAIQGNS